jgi:hypothetical protein
MDGMLVGLPAEPVGIALKKLHLLAEDPILAKAGKGWRKAPALILSHNFVFLMSNTIFYGTRYFNLGRYRDERDKVA